AVHDETDLSNRASARINHGSIDLRRRNVLKREINGCTFLAGGKRDRPSRAEVGRPRIEHGRIADGLRRYRRIGFGAGWSGHRRIPTPALTASHLLLRPLNVGGRHGSYVLKRPVGRE